MVVWFKHGSCTIGVEDGIVRARDFAALTSLLQAANTLESERDHLLAEAHAQAQRVTRDAQDQAQQVTAQAQAQAESTIDAAHQQAIALLAEARKKLDSAYEEGLGKGEREAITQWTSRALTHAKSSRLGLERQQERLSGIVSLAVERMVEQEDKQALYVRALRTVSKMVKDVPLLTLRVNFQDKVAAQKALNAVAGQLVSDMPIEVVGDDALAGGSCMFESDQGVIDVGLETQLAAIKRAVNRAAQSTGALVEVAEASSEEAAAESTQALVPAQIDGICSSELVHAQPGDAKRVTMPTEEGNTGELAGDPRYVATSSADGDDFLDEDLFDDEEDNEFNDEEDEELIDEFSDEFADDEEFADELLPETKESNSPMPQSAVRLSNPTV
jgi:type III secretion protein L